MKRRSFLWLLGCGAAAGASSWVRAQQAVPLVGVVVAGTRDTSTFPEPFLSGMKQLGWDEDHNYRVLILGTEGHNDRYQALIGELVAKRVNVIVVFGNPGIDAARRATAAIPIVGTTDDLVNSGFAASMTRPGDNITGVSIFGGELNVQRLELLHEAVPAAKRIGVLADPTGIAGRIEDAGRALHLELVLVNASNPEQVRQALEMLDAARVEAVNVLTSPVFANVRGMIVDWLNRKHVPAIYEWPDIGKEGGLLGYGASFRYTVWPQVARLVDRVLRGARPEDLPIEQPEKVDLVINLKTAEALGLSFPPALLARADEVIE